LTDRLIFGFVDLP
jgi:hypothetical protein